MLSLVSNLQLAPVDKTVLLKWGRDWTKAGNLVGNGAYTLKEAIVNSKIIVEKNPKYWDSAAVHLTKVTYLPIENTNADLKMFQSGETDWTSALPPGSYAQLRSTYPTDIRNSPLLALGYYSLNNNDPMLKDVRVRKALSMVIDRDLLVEKVMAAGQTPQYGLIVKGLAGADVTAYDWAQWPMAQKVSQAKQLLAQTGVPSSTKIRLMYNTNDYQKRIAVFVASEWKTKLGLNIEMESLEFKVMLKRLHEGDYQVGRYSWYADYNDATSFLTLVQCGSDQNLSGSCNQKADELVTQGNLSEDQNKRKALLTQAAKLAMEDYPFIPLSQGTLARLVKSYVGGYSEANIFDRFRSKDLYIIKQ
jgi:oligopeptide transport system substrate-binding protein